MATQGVVSVSDELYHTLFKIVTGCDGYNAKELALAILEKVAEGNTLTIDLLYDLALGCGFGDADTLVVMSDDAIKEKGDFAVSPLYRMTFKNPWFNPRWEQGTADHVLCVDIHRKQIFEFVDPRFVTKPVSVRAERPHITPGKLGELCGLSTRQVGKWMDEGIVKGFKLPGSKHRKIYVDSAIETLEENKIHVPDSLRAMLSKEVTQGDNT